MRRATAGGVARWEAVEDEPGDAPGDALVALLYGLAEAAHEAAAPRGVTPEPVPGVSRCGLCGAWMWEGACGTPHQLGVPAGFDGDVGRWVAAGRSRRSRRPRVVVDS